MLVFDGHLDLAFNAINLNRDLSKTVYEIRKYEEQVYHKTNNKCTVALPEMKKGKVGLCFSSILPRTKINGYWRSFKSPDISYASAKGQLAYYKALEEKGLVSIIKNSEMLEKHSGIWQDDYFTDGTLGFVISMEGANALRKPEDALSWWNDGLRVLSLSHYGADEYAHGTGSKGGITQQGRKLLGIMEDLKLILDVTHLSEESFSDALELFEGSVIASHNNCRSIVPGERQFSDEQIRKLCKRESVIGISFDAWMLYPKWVGGKTSNKVVSMENVVDQIDYVCNLARDTLHVAIGSDLDGGFGWEQCPHDLETIADLQKIPILLEKRGYCDTDIQNIMFRNWLRILNRSW